LNSITYISPYNRAPLQRAGEHLLSDGETLWPHLDGIAYLRPRESVRQPAVEALQRGDLAAALRHLLRDQDPFAPLAAPAVSTIDALLTPEDLSLRKAMELLNYGPVANYFAHRWSAPTFLTGLALLEQCTGNDQAVVEVACGIDHFLRHLEANGKVVLGTDLVFSKLWLARQYLHVRGPLVCGDITSQVPLQSTAPCTVFCHDALYFFEDKPGVLSTLRGLATGGNLAIGHVHTNAVDHDVSGTPLSVETYQDMSEGALAYYDDATLLAAWFEKEPPKPSAKQDLHRAEALNWLEGQSLSTRSLRQPAGPLIRNPLLEETRGAMRLRWPSDRFRREYEPDAAYLSENVAAINASGQIPVETLDPVEQDKLFTQRMLLDLPNAW